MTSVSIARWLPVVLSAIAALSAYSARAQSLPVKTRLTQGFLRQVNPYFSTQSITYSDGTILTRSVINGPSAPPPGYELERSEAVIPEPRQEMGLVTLNVPAFRWVLGCSAVSGAMIAGYHDRNGYPNMYTGPANGGLMPLNDLSWPSWMDAVGSTYPNNPLVASHDGSDGRNTPGSIDDYWISYGSALQDPYITESRVQHTWGDSVGDYMKTSQSGYGNSDGATTFYYNSSASPLTCGAMESLGIQNDDGAYGRKLFYEAKGYTVTDCFTQSTDNRQIGGFSFSQYKAEIDAGHPVLLHLMGHSIVGVGYDDSSNTVYIHDTWDNGAHAMTWGGSYSGMDLWGVSIVNLEQPDLLLSNSRFKVEVDWRTLTGGTGKGIAVPLTSDSGYFWFFENTNVELMVKMLDGRSVNGHFWLFWGALTDVQFTITVTDTQTGAVKQYFGTQGVQTSGNDIRAF